MRATVDAAPGPMNTAEVRPAEASLPARVTFRDSGLDAAFDRDGFVSVPFLDGDALEELRSLWAQVGPREVSGIYSNVHDLDAVTNRHVDDTISRVFAGPAQCLLEDAHLAGASFLVKGTGANSASTPHQDWNNVEEHLAQSVSIWCPLTDVDDTNGALQVIPGSHRLRRSIRSLDTPSLYLDFTEELAPHLRCVPIKAGQAVFYAHNLFHGSRPNSSGSTRVCAVSGVVPRGTRSVHYRRSTTLADAHFDVLEVDRDFYFSGLGELQSGRLPSTARVVDTVVLPRPTLDPEDVLGMSGVGPQSRSEGVDLDPGGDQR